MLSWLRRHAVPIGGFRAGRWQDTVPDEGARRDALTLATFNVWFDERHADARYRAIADLLAREAPDIMVFQEITAPALNLLLSRSWIRENYLRAAMTGRRTGNYGQLLLSRVPIRRATYVRLPTPSDAGCAACRRGRRRPPARRRIGASRQW